MILSKLGMWFVWFLLDVPLVFSRREINFLLSCCTLYDMISWYVFISDRNIACRQSQHVLNIFNIRIEEAYLWMSSIRKQSFTRWDFLIYFYRSLSCTLNFLSSLMKSATHILLRWLLVYLLFSRTEINVPAVCWK